MIKLMILIFMLILIPYQQLEASFNFEYRGNIVDRITYYQLKDSTLLNPDSKLTSFHRYKNELYADIIFNFFYKDWLKLVINQRPILIKENGKGTFKNNIDDAYFDIKLKEGLFLTLGKENFQEGVGLSYNPSDFIGQDKEMDYSKTEEERKLDRRGSYIIRLESISDNLTFSLLVAPNIKNLQKQPSKTIYKIYSLIKDVDISLHYFHHKQKGLGFNASTIIGNNLELHSELALRKGSNRQFLKKKNELGYTGSGVYEYEIYNPDDDKKSFIRAIIGGHYTFLNKTNLIIEYFFNEDGYTKSEFKEFIGLVEDSSDKFKNPPEGFSADIFKENLRLANSLMTFRYLRRNYLYIRLSNPELFNYYDAQLGILLNIDDKSFCIIPVIDYKRFDNMIISFGANWFRGDSQSEFGLVGWDAELHLGIKYFFRGMETMGMLDN